MNETAFCWPNPNGCFGIQLEALMIGAHVAESSLHFYSSPTTIIASSLGLFNNPIGLPISTAGDGSCLGRDKQDLISGNLHCLILNVEPNKAGNCCVHCTHQIKLRRNPSEYWHSCEGVISVMETFDVLQHVAFRAQHLQAERGNRRRQSILKQRQRV